MLQLHTMTDRKVCLGCSAEKLLTEYGPRVRGKLGRKARCYACDAADCRAAYAKDPARAKARVCRWQAKNKGKCLKSVRDWRARDPEHARRLKRESTARVKTTLTREQIVERNTRWYRNNKETAKRKTTAWRAAHPEVMRRSRKKWELNNPDKVVANSFNMSCRRRGAPGAGITPVEWRETLEKCGHLCFYCTRHESECGRLHKDHVIPLKRGGANELSNIVPACAECNSRKAAKPIERLLPLFMLPA